MTPDAHAAEACVASMPQGTECACALADLHPTQRAVGMIHVEEIKSSGFEALAEHVRKPKHHALVVVGPGGQLFLVDGHHHARAMIELRPDGASMCRIDRQVSGLPTDPKLFWSRMAAEGLAHLEGPDGVAHDNVFPPAALTGLQDDPFRTVASWVEDACKAKLEGDFADFKLAGLLRSAQGAVPPADEADRDAALKRGLAAIRDPANRQLLAGLKGWEKRTACQ